MRSLIFLELNEINFDFVKRYLELGSPLPNLQDLLASNFTTTRSEPIYENIEPWIQWVSVHTGREYSNHGVFRLGDIVNTQHRQFFEVIEENGYRVGAVSPMNAKNALSKPSFFIPDPWTQTPSDGSILSRWLSQAISQAVNDNAEAKLSFSSILKLLVVVLYSLPIPRLLWLTKKIHWAISRPWRKAIFLDLMLFEIFCALHRNKRPNFSVLFLNAGAHIQHHYMLSSEALPDSFSKTNPDWYVAKDEDPLFELLEHYDALIGRLKETASEFIIATGLKQEPYEKPCFYYRLKNHSRFLSSLGISFESVFPRMTRDFLIKFASNRDRNEAFAVLRSLSLRGLPLFEEIDMRENELFVTLTFGSEIFETDRLCLQNGDKISIYDCVVFVAIKNGHHNQEGFVFRSGGLPSENWPKANDHVSRLHDYIVGLFPGV